MAGAKMEFSMDDELIAPVIESHIQAAIVEAMGGREDVIERIVASVLKEKVDHQGNSPRYRSDEKYTYLDWLCRDAIRKAAKAAIAQIILERQDELHEEVKRQISNSQGEWVMAMLTGLAKAVESAWKFNVEVSLPK